MDADGDSLLYAAHNNGLTELDQQSYAANSLFARRVRPSTKSKKLRPRASPSHMMHN